MGKSESAQVCVSWYVLCKGRQLGICWRRMANGATRAWGHPRSKSPRLSCTRDRGLAGTREQAENRSARGGTDEFSILGRSQSRATRSRYLDRGLSEVNALEINNRAGELAKKCLG